MKRTLSIILAVVLLMLTAVPTLAEGERAFGLITERTESTTFELSDIIENYRPHTKRQIDDFRIKLDQKYHLNLQYFYVGLFFPDVKSRVFLISNTVLDKGETGKRIRTNDMGLFANGDSVMRIKADNGFVFLPYAKDIQTEEGARTFDASAYDAVGSQYCYLQFSDEAIEFLDSLSWYEREYFMLEFYLCIFESGNVADIAWDYLYTHEDSALWGYCGEGCYPGDGFLVEWEFNENTKTLVIYGNGDIANTIAGSASFDGQPPKTVAPWRDFCDEIEKVIIKPGITSIGHGNFMGCKNLKSVSIADTVTSIGQSAFEYCEKLYEINIPDSVVTIGLSAFAYCHSLYKIVLGNSVEIIEPFTFFDCYNLVSITVPKSLKSDKDGFGSCSKLVEVINESDLDFTAYFSPGIHNVGRFVYDFIVDVHTGESKLIELGDYLFYTYEGVNYLVGYTGDDKEPVLPDSFNGESYIIYYQAFCNSDITSITIPKCVKEIYSSAFANCTALTDVYYAGDLKAWNAIDIEEDYNESLTDAVLHFIGDADGDGEITAADILNFKKMLCGAVNTSGIDIKTADMDRDGRITAKDLLMLRKMLAK